jgi:hypothetical protein
MGLAHHVGNLCKPMTSMGLCYTFSLACMTVQDFLLSRIYINLPCHRVFPSINPPGLSVSLLYFLHPFCSSFHPQFLHSDLQHTGPFTALSHTPPNPWPLSWIHYHLVHQSHSKESVPQYGKHIRKQSRSCI